MQEAHAQTHSPNLHASIHQGQNSSFSVRLVKQEQEDNQKQLHCLLFCSNNNWHFSSIFYHDNQFRSANTALDGSPNSHKTIKNNLLRDWKRFGNISFQHRQTSITDFAFSSQSLHTNYLSWTPFCHCRFLTLIFLNTTLQTTVLRTLLNPFLSTDSQGENPTFTAFLIPFLSSSSLAGQWTSQTILLNCDMLWGFHSKHLRMLCVSVESTCELGLERHAEFIKKTAGPCNCIKKGCQGKTGKGIHLWWER